MEVLFVLIYTLQTYWISYQDMQDGVFQHQLLSQYFLNHSTSHLPTNQPTNLSNTIYSTYMLMFFSVSLNFGSIRSYFSLFLTHCACTPWLFLQKDGLLCQLLLKTSVVSVLLFCNHILEVIGQIHCFYSRGVYQTSPVFFISISQLFT